MTGAARRGFVTKTSTLAARRFVGPLVFAALALLVFVAATPPLPPPRPADLTPPQTPKEAPPLPPPRPAEISPAPAPVVAAPAISPEELAAASADCDKVMAPGSFSAVRQPPILEGPDCVVAAPVQVEKINLPDGRQIKLAPPPVLGCAMAAALADWLRDEGAALLDEGPRRLTALETAGGYQCRHRNSVDTSKMSEHAKGNALDLVGAQWGAARQDFTAPELDLDLATRLQQSLCARFSTVLGPGSDGFHEGHIHIDLEKRRSSGKLCEWDLQ